MLQVSKGCLLLLGVGEAISSAAKLVPQGSVGLAIQQVTAKTRYCEMVIMSEVPCASGGNSSSRRILKNLIITSVYKFIFIVISVG